MLVSFTGWCNDDDSSVTSAAATNTYLSPPLSPVPSAWSFPVLGQSLSDYSNTSGTAKL